MTQQEQRLLDLASARDLPPEQAAFFHMGPSKRIADGVVFLSSFANVAAFTGESGVLLVDTGQERFTPRVLQDLRANYSQAPVEAVVYTHGHIDHVTGAEGIIAEARQRGDRRPHFVGHELVRPRFDRYKLTSHHNDHINRIQFNLPPDVQPFTTAPWTYPDIEHKDGMEMVVGGMRFEFHHARGETDDETWVWQPDTRVLCTGDTFVWCSPNAGNPYKVQRYAKDWADALEKMAALKPEHLLPGHGPAMSGQGQVEEALLSTAHLLRSVHDQVVDGMNSGKWLEDIIRDMDWPSTDKPWLQPIYDHPEFIARNVYRFYGGWWNGDPADMLPAHSEEVAAALIGAVGAAPVLERARAARAAGDLKLACHLVDFVRKGDPQNKEGWELWRDVFNERAAQERSLMARGAFRYAVRMAEAKLKALGD
ncbi:MAG TPA: alkyl sulfatase dimerization domain-containing protein [Dehalococcoidia bacterium]|jgi:alkyl sulfatase BDS1-like metallo-beta-lactamase superfamily hydrolase|nr:alkyl sulfatase dimerization domain-containing protein [Dehalococcoidia bacterium]